MNVNEKRKSERVTGAIQIELKRGRGITRDFNTDGVYFITDQPLSVGERVDFAMTLRSSDPLGPVRVHCKGKVVRIEPSWDKLGVAVAISDYLVEEAEGGWKKKTANA